MARKTGTDTLRDGGRIEVAPDHPGRLDRRQFLKATAFAGAAVLLGRGAGVLGAEPAAAAPAAVPAAKSGELATRILGRTGAKVTVLGLGTAPVGEGPVEVPDGVKVFGEVLDRGVTYVDTARIYGEAEEMLGHLLPKRRDKLFIATKVSTDNAAAAEKSLAESLKMLKLDAVDLIHIHSVGSRNLDKVLAKDGVLEYLLKQKQAGKCRFIGVSGHNRPANFVRMLETDQIDVIMCVLNYADRFVYDFESKVLPEARKRKAGIVAMKAYVGIKGGFPNHRKGYVGCATEPQRLPQALAYALDLEGVSLAVVGPYTVEQAIQNVEFAKNYKPLPAGDRDDLLAVGKKLAETIGPRYGPV